MKIRYVGDAPVVIPVGGGLGVAPGQVVDEPAADLGGHVASDRFEAVRRARRSGVGS